ncbi:hypothetical protein AS850_06540 [Frondihabitans sp. 762G35]|uniref:hypothetical protein n=1 Tax=Frondihabitans sp. 762G35 TaxID=1446794 RepID=UPI000D21EEE6|nr:hypothetical protein [Frondihabitans sp. 762G35]ARC56732.1 hypothetical protein AS850_06540 [Frondihabitans sp. 762G35]
MSDDDQRPARPVTSMSLRAERLRASMARAAGSQPHRDDPGLSAPRRPPLARADQNRWAVAALAVGIVAVLLNPVYLTCAAGLALSLLGLRRARALRARGVLPGGRSLARWGLGLSLFAAAQFTFYLVVAPLLGR